MLRYCLGLILVLAGCDSARELPVAQCAAVLCVRADKTLVRAHPSGFGLLVSHPGGLARRLAPRIQGARTVVEDSAGGLMVLDGSGSLWWVGSRRTLLLDEYVNSRTAMGQNWIVK